MATATVKEVKIESKPRVVRPEAFNPVLLNSPALEVTGEQFDAVDKAIDVASSDTQFAAKLKKVIKQILTGGNAPLIPSVTSLVPSTIAIGAPSITLRVRGTNFTPNSIIVFAGHEEPTTLVSATEVTTGIDMSVWHGPDVVPVAVQEGSILSNEMEFEFTDVAKSVTPHPAIVTSHPATTEVKK